MIFYRVPENRQNKIKFFQLSDNLVPFLALGQALGRWGNYFNQELFGQPTTQWYGIFIALEKRVKGFEEFNYFQPSFFYESFLNLILFSSGEKTLVFVPKYINGASMP